MNLWLAFPVSIQQKEALKCSHAVLKRLITHTTPTGNIPEAPELGTTHYKGQNVDDVPYKGVLGLRIVTSKHL